MPTAYSYIRFSSESQRMGDSVRRQIAAAERYAAEHSLVLDTHSYRDLGVSAYKGRNATQGKLGTFLRAVDAGTIPAQSILLVESLDRLSRNDVDDALELFLSIIRRGVTLVTLADGQTYSTATIKRDRGMSLIVSILVMMRAHEESVTKGERIRAAWKGRAARGGVFTRSCPAWIELVAGRWAVRADRAEIVQGIFRLYLEGAGMPSIARLLNAAEIDTFGRSKFWQTHSVFYLLHQQAVHGMLGREQCGEPPIPNYYPAIVSKDDFDRVALLSRSKLKAKRVIDGCFLFAARSTCHLCGGPMSKISGQGHDYRLRCSRAFHGSTCDAPSISGRSADMAFFKEVAHGKALPGIEDDANVAAAKTRLAALHDRLRAARAERDELLQLALAGNRITPMAKRLAAIETTVGALEADAAVQRKAARPRHFAEFATARHLCTSILSAETTVAGKFEYQLQLRDLLGRVLERVAIDAARREMTITFVGGTTAVVPMPGLIGAFKVGNVAFKARRTTVKA